MKSGRKWKSSSRGKTGLGLGPRHRERTGWMGRLRCKACVNKRVKEQWRASVPGSSACCLDSYLENNQFSCMTQSFSFSLKLYQNIVDLEYCVNFSCTVTQLYTCVFSYAFSVQSLSRVRLFATPWTTARQASLSITNSQSLSKLMSIELVMPSNHLILCRPLLLLPSIFPSIRVFSNESALRIRWPKYWSFSYNIGPSNEHPGLISFRMDWLDLLTVQGTLKSLLQHHSSKASILLHSAFFIVQLSHLYITTGKTIALTMLFNYALSQDIEDTGPPRWHGGEESACQCRSTRDAGWTPGSGRPPGGENGNPLRYTCLENSMDEEPGRLQSTGSQRFGHNRETLLHFTSPGNGAARVNFR